MNQKTMLAALAIATVIVAGIFGIFHLSPNSRNAVSRELVPVVSVTQRSTPTIVSDAVPVARLPAPIVNPPDLPVPEQTSSIDKLAKTKKTAGQKPPIQDPAARVALSFVGADPDAEAYWIKAINDPSLPPEERKDLIEDLNEDGLSDPHHPGPEDMPLIASRIQLIEQLAPDATDPVNAKAFGEAYKDLVNLYNGQPAQ